MRNDSRQSSKNDISIWKFPSELLVLGANYYIWFSTFSGKERIAPDISEGEWESGVLECESEKSGSEKRRGVLLSPSADVARGHVLILVFGTGTSVPISRLTSTRLAEDPQTPKKSDHRRFNISIFIGPMPDYRRRLAGPS